MVRPLRLRINEIFHSVQGEGAHVGVRCAFIRLTGCHLRCTYCDTEYAFHEGGWLELDAILQTVRAFQCPTVEVTGGEPLLQPAVFPLLERLADEYRAVLLETSGALSVARVDPRVIRIVDLKCPSSGEAHRNHWPNLALLRPQDELKFVICTREDYEWARATIGKHNLAGRCNLLMSPACNAENEGNLLLAQGNLEPRVLAEWILEDRLDVRFGLQLHKLIWSPTARGV